MTKLEADRDMELEERQKLEEEIRAKQEEIERVKTTVDEKDEETKKLQEEMADARRQLEVKLKSQNFSFLLFFFLFFFSLLHIIHSSVDRTYERDFVIFFHFLNENMLMMDNFRGTVLIFLEFC